MIFKEGELRLLWPFYLASFFHGLFNVISPFLIVYFRDLDFSFFQIQALFSVALITVFLFEVPTGAVADLVGRKMSVLIGFVIIALTAIGIGLTTNYFIIMLLWAFFGIGSTFISGADEALVVDKIKNKKDLIREYYTKNSSIVHAGFVLAPILATLIVKYFSKTELWFVMGFGFIIPILIYIFFVTEKFKRKKITVKSVSAQSLQGAKYNMKHPILSFLLLIGAFELISMSPEDGWQPLLVQFGLPETYLGVVYSLVGAVLIISPFIGRALAKIFPVTQAAAIVLIFKFLIISSLYFVNHPYFEYLIMIYVLFQSTEAVFDPIIRPYVQNFIPSKIRATVISFRAMFYSLFFAIIILPAGYLLDQLGIKQTILIANLFLIPAILLFFSKRFLPENMKKWMHKK